MRRNLEIAKIFKISIRVSLSLVLFKIATGVLEISTKIFTHHLQTLMVSIAPDLTHKLIT
jgi:hypothetical protein